MPELHFVDVGPDDEKDLRRWYDLASGGPRGRPTGRPDSRLRHLGRPVTAPMPGSESHLVLAEVESEVVGWFAQWLSTRENTRRLPRRGVSAPGPSAARVRSRAGRRVDAPGDRRSDARRLIAEGTESDGAAFATALGFRAVLADTQRRLDLAHGRPGGLDRPAHRRAVARDGYSLVQWIGASTGRSTCRAWPPCRAG